MPMVLADAVPDQRYRLASAIIRVPEAKNCAPHGLPIRPITARRPEVRTPDLGEVVMGFRSSANFALDRLA